MTVESLVVLLRARERELSAIYENVPGIVFYIAVEPNGELRFLSVSDEFLLATELTRGVDRFHGQRSSKTCFGLPASTGLMRFKSARHGGHEVIRRIRSNPVTARVFGDSDGPNQSGNSHFQRRGQRTGRR